MQRREHTRARLLSAVGASRVATRKSLSETTGLSRSAIAQSVADLLSEGLLEEVPLDDRPAGRGRPPTALRLVAPRCIVLGVDLQTTRVHVAIGDQNGVIVAEKRTDFDAQMSPGDAVDFASRLARRIIAVAGIDLDLLGPTVVALPDPAEWEPTADAVPADGHWFEERFAAQLGPGVRAVPAADVGAVGEHRVGAAAGHDHVLYVRLSDAATAALLVEGDVYVGAHGVAGRIGHIQVPELNGWCRCGKRGCLDTVVSGRQILNQLALTNIRMDECASDLSLMRLSDHPVAARVISESGRALGRVLADLSNFLDPELIVLSGDVGATGRPLLIGVQESMQRHFGGSAEVVCTRLSGRAELLGAITMAADLALALRN